MEIRTSGKVVEVAYGPDEQVTVTTLAAFDPTSVDMLTIVLIGSSTSRAFTRGDGRTMAYTPRGYAAKSSVVTEPDEGASALGARP